MRGGRLDHPHLRQLADGGEGDVRADGVGAEGQEHGEVDDLARFAGLDDDARGGAQPFADEVVVQAGDRQQRGDRRVPLIHVVVGQHQERGAFGDLLLGALEHFLERLAQLLAPAVRREEHIQVARDHLGPAGAAQPQHVLRGEDGMVQLELPAMLGGLDQQVALAADEAHEGHHQLLAQRVDGRIGHLREKLLEVIEEDLRALGEDRQRRIVPHGADGLLAADGHGGDDHLQFLFRIAEGVLLAQQHLRVLGGDVAGGQQAAQFDPVVLDPVTVRALARDFGLDFAVGDDAVLLQVHQEHAPGLKASPAEDLVAGNVQHPGLAGHDHQAVAGDGVARGAQAVAVERRADVAAVGEHEGRRAVPRLHDGGMVLVKGALVLGHHVLPPPRLGDEHHHGVRQAAPPRDKQFQQVVQNGGVASLLLEDRLELLKVRAEERRGQQRLARAHAVDVAAQGVDLAVVRKHAEGLRQPPHRKRVGAVSLMHDGESAGQRRVAQVRIELRKLGGGEHPLVREGAAGKAGDVELAGVRMQRANRLLGRAAEEVKFALERLGGNAPATEEQLPDLRLSGAGELPERARVHRHFAPAQQFHPFRTRRALDRLDARRRQRGVGGQKDHADGVFPHGRKLDARPFALAAEEVVGNLDEQTRAVAGGLVAPERAAVLQVHEDAHPLLDDAVARLPLQIGDEADAATVVILSGMIQPRRQRPAGPIASPLVRFLWHGLSYRNSRMC